MSLFWQKEQLLSLGSRFLTYWNLTHIMVNITFPPQLQAKHFGNIESSALDPKRVNSKSRTILAFLTYSSPWWRETLVFDLVASFQDSGDRFVPAVKSHLSERNNSIASIIQILAFISVTVFSVTTRLYSLKKKEFTHPDLMFFFKSSNICNNVVTALPLSHSSSAGTLASSYRNAVFKR